MLSVYILVPPYAKLELERYPNNVSTTTAEIEYTPYPITTDRNSAQTPPCKQVYASSTPSQSIPMEYYSVQGYTSLVSHFNIPILIPRCPRRWCVNCSIHDQCNRGPGTPRWFLFPCCRMILVHCLAVGFSFGRFCPIQRPLSLLDPTGFHGAFLRLLFLELFVGGGSGNNVCEKLEVVYSGYGRSCSIRPRSISIIFIGLPPVLGVD